MEPQDVKDFMAKHSLKTRDLVGFLGVSGALIEAWRQGTRKIPDWLPLALQTLEGKLADENQDGFDN